MRAIFVIPEGHRAETGSSDRRIPAPRQGIDQSRPDREFRQVSGTVQKQSHQGARHPVEPGRRGHLWGNKMCIRGDTLWALGIQAPPPVLEAACSAVSQAGDL